jgi:transposase-like protein
MEKRSKAETEKFYREFLAEQDRSGLSVREFAEKRGVPPGTLSFWRHELKRRDAAAGARKPKRVSKPKFVPVSVVGAAEAPKAPTSDRPRAGYEIVLGQDRVLRLPAEFDEKRVAALVRAVASC